MLSRFFLLLGLTLPACLGGAGPAQAQSQEERAVRALLDRFIQAANSTDQKASQQILADHSSSRGPFFPPFAGRIGTFAELESEVKQSQGQIIARSYAPTSPIEVHADHNLAWAAYTWRAAITSKDGTQGSYEGRATATFVREGKQWKFAHWQSSIAAPPPLTAQLREAESQKVIELERSAWEAFKNKQVAALEDYFADDAAIFIESSAYRVSGKANILRGLKNASESAELRSYQMLEPQVQLLANTALLTYYFTESGIEAGKEFSLAGKTTKVFVKRDGAWRLLHEHRSVNR